MTEQEFWDILHQMPDPEPVFWRLYYDVNGDPVCYSMEALPGNYINVSPGEYAIMSFAVKVINGKLLHLAAHAGQKLVPNDLAQGTQCHAGDVSIITKENGIYWSKKQYGFE